MMWRRSRWRRRTGGVPNMYAEDDFLALSGIQHFAFCRRQWGLIHLDQSWSENLLTAQGRIVHERAHDEALRERRGDTIIVRNLAVRSSGLGLQGYCDVVEFHRCADGHPLANERGLWRELPVEYKRGTSKASDADRLQLCAQAMCLEEMMGSDIAQGCLYYNATRSREWVALDAALRQKVIDATMEMHTLFARHHVPKVKSHGACRSCSLNELCEPKVIGRSAKEYLERELGGLA